MIESLELIADKYFVAFKIAKWPEDYVDINIFVYWLSNHSRLGRTFYEYLAVHILVGLLV